MKILIIIMLAVALIGCSKEEEPAQEIQCKNIIGFWENLDTENEIRYLDFSHAVYGEAILDHDVFDDYTLFDNGELEYTGLFSGTSYYKQDCDTLWVCSEEYQLDDPAYETQCDEFK